jgi:preprotein translocase subunit SecG
MDGLKMSPKHQRSSDRDGRCSRKAPAVLALLAAFALTLMGLTVPAAAFADVLPTLTSGTDAFGSDASTGDASTADEFGSDASTADASGTDAFGIDASTADASAADGSSSADAPATDAPATDAPATDAPATDAPAADDTSSTDPSPTDTPPADPSPTSPPSTDTSSPPDAESGTTPPEQPVASKPEAVPPAYPAEPPPDADSSASGDITANQPLDPVTGASVPETETAATPDTGAVYPGGGGVIEQALTLTAVGQDAARRARASGVLPPGIELSTADGAKTGDMATDAFTTGSTLAPASGDAPATVEPPTGAANEVAQSESGYGVTASIVPPPSFNPGRLARTGFEAGWLVWLGVGLALLGGLFAVIAVRRRRVDEAEDVDPL